MVEDHMRVLAERRDKEKRRDRRVNAYMAKHHIGMERRLSERRSRERGNFSSRNY